jgi:hypothetical protein
MTVMEASLFVDDFTSRDETVFPASLASALEPKRRCRVVKLIGPCGSLAKGGCYADHSLVAGRPVGRGYRPPGHARHLVEEVRKKSRGLNRGRPHQPRRTAGFLLGLKGFIERGHAGAWIRDITRNG